MKVHLFDIENQLEPSLVEEAQEMIRGMQEYDIQRNEDDFYHCISVKPDFHVEIRISEEGLANPKCHCATFKRTKKCKHAVASLLLVREYIQRGRKVRRKSHKEVLDEVLRKLNVSELRSFLSSYALSHSALRSEILSNYIYLTKKPDYHGLFNDLAPVDKYGQIRLNRNNIKTVRSFSSTLLKRANELLKEKALLETLQIMEAVLLHLHRLWMKVPQFQEQINVELKQAYRIFEALCLQPMAPRLQQRAINLAIDICEREGYRFPPGSRPLINMSESFILEEKTRKEAFAIAEKKALAASSQTIKWTALVFHWMRIWSLKISSAALRKQLEKNLPEVIREFYQHGDHEDVLYAINISEKENPDPLARKGILTAGLRSAKILGNKEKLSSFAYELALHHLDTDAWEMLLEEDKVKALRILDLVQELTPPGSDQETDIFLLKGWRTAGDGTSMIARLRSMNDINVIMEFDLYLKDKYRDELSGLYAGYIVHIREAFGGVMARQKLNNIFGHLKSFGLTDEVADKIKGMEQQKKSEEINHKTAIKGFVFDLDGVIVDTAVHHFQAWKKIMQELGTTITEEDDQHTRGAGRMESLDYLLHQYRIKLSGDEKLYWAAKKNDVYVDSINAITPADLLPGALDFLEQSRKAGLSLALGSASKNARAVLAKLGIADRFDAVLDGNDAKASKPDPEIFQKACAALGLRPETVVVFEDAPKGVQAALSAGCKAVGIGSASTLSAAHLVIPGLDHSTPAQIIERLA